jgi:hypothetical protein
VGDVLLSSGRKTGLQTNLPLVGDINRLLGLKPNKSVAARIGC